MSFRENARKGSARNLVVRTAEEPLTEDLIQTRIRIENALLSKKKETINVPADHVEVKHVQRFQRAQDPSIDDAPLFSPHGIDLESLHPFYREFIGYCKSNFTVLRNKYEAYMTIQELRALRTPGHADLRDESLILTDSDDENGSSNTTSFQPYFPGFYKLEHLSQCWSTQAVPTIMDLYDPEGNTSDIEKRVPEFPAQILPGTQVSIECVSLSFEVQEFEPVFCSMCVYDTKTKQKITENFFFDTCSETSLNYLRPKTTAEIETKIRRALVRIINPSTSLILLVRMEKCLYGDPSEAVKPYISGFNPKLLPKYQYVCERLGEYRQSFCWGYAPLCTEKEGRATIIEGTLRVDHLYQSQNDITTDSILELVQEKTKAQKSLTSIPGSISFNLTLLANDHIPLGTRDHSYRPVKTVFPTIQNMTPSTKENEFPAIASQLSRELLSFPSSTGTFYSTFFNYIYLYPISVNFTNKSTAGSCRNICVRVELRQSDSMQDEGRMEKAFYSKSSEQRFKSSQTTQVVYHEKFPMFHDEMKIRLPFPVNEKHHLFFTFLHVRCKTGGEKEEKGPVSTTVGYAWLPLFTEAILEDKIHELPIASDIKPFYMEENVRSRLTWIDKQKPLFSVSTKTVSSIYHPDKRVLKYFEESEKVLKNPASVSSEVGRHFSALLGHAPICLSYFPVIVNRTLDLMCDVSSEVALVLFDRLVLMITNICSSISANMEKRPDFLSEYIYYEFDNINGRRPHLYLTISSAWISSINTHESKDDPVSVTMTRICWFFFELITKSLNMSRLDTSSQDHNLEYITFVDNVKLIARDITEKAAASKDKGNISKYINVNLALFLRELLPHVDVRIIQQLIYAHIRELPVLQYQVAFISVICDYEHYLPLNQPELVRLPEAGDLYDFFESRFPLAYLVSKPLSHLFAQYRSETKPRPSNRNLVANMIRKLFSKHDLDFRYQNSTTKSLIALMYLPILDLFVENVDVFETEVMGEYGILDAEEQRNFLVSVAFVLMYIPKETISSWLFKQEKARIAKYIRLLKISSQAFEPPYSSPTKRDGSVDGGQPSDNFGLLAKPEKKIDPKDKMTQTAVHLTILESMASILNDLALEWYRTSENTQLADCIEEYMYVLATLLKCRTSQPTFMILINLLTQTISSFAGYISAHGSIALQDIVSQIVILASYSEAKRNMAATLLHHIAVVQYWQSKEFSALRSMLVVSSSSIVPQLKSDESVLGVLSSLSSRSAKCQSFFGRTAIEDHDSETRVAFISVASDIYRLLFKLRAAILSSKSPEEATSLATVVKVLKTQLKAKDDRLSEDEREYVVKGPPAALNDTRTITEKDAASITTAKIQEMQIAATYSIQDELFSAVGEIDGWIYGPRAGVVVECWRRVWIIIRESIFINPSWKAVQLEDGEIAAFARELSQFFQIAKVTLEDAIRFRDLDDQNEFENTIEVHYRVATRYEGHPDVKVAKLESLANLLQKRDYYAEAASALRLVTDIKLQYLKTHKHLDTGSPVEKLQGFSPVKRGSSSRGFDFARRQSALPGLDSQSGGNAALELLLGHAFNKQGAMKTLDEVIQLLEKAEMYELIPEVVEKIISLYRGSHEYSQLHKLYSRIADAYNKIMEAENQFRAFGRYYRVGFYGRDFKEMDGKEFVYRELKITMLTEITDRLKKQVEKKYKQIPVIFPDSRAVDRKQLAADKLYLQITSLEPHFDEKDPIPRTTTFEKSNNLYCFVYETPFTKTGAAQTDSVIDQYKMKTFLRVETGFPTVLIRQPVIEKWEVELDPLSNSIEAIQRRTALLRKELESAKPSIKNLQSLLQGSVLVQVNVGVLAIANGFLGDLHKYPSEGIALLREAFQAFLSACKTALQKNKMMITKEQDAFQVELEKGYRSLERQLSALL
eukprot:TRINITY_DN3433_c0_g1_i5.p1 TRINITY_DN3433_c0_g1~~TRINITY_DN3433_c0_g1_i5.p1  ORF type:complete len:1895 (-),score=353.68 TRINITY_DN3433_c0_g1_i5:366-6050(-)